MALHLTSSVSDIPGIGSGAALDFRHLGIISVQDLLSTVPFRYDDYSQVKKIKAIRVGQTVTVDGVIESITLRPAKNKRTKIVEAVLTDETGSLPIVWFNQEYLLNVLHPGANVSLAGTVDIRFKRAMVNPLHEPMGKRVLTGRLVPVYRLSGSLKMFRVRSAVRAVLPVLVEMQDWLPETICQQEQFPSLTEALHGVHVPESSQALDRAVQRLKFDELFLHQLMFAHVRREREVRTARSVPIHETALKKFVAILPFELTDAQRKASWQIVQDLVKPHPMNRLLQGDVGSGKTAVAAVATAGVLAAQQLVVYLAPTEILCAQQHRVFTDWFVDEPVALFTRSQKRIGHEEVKKEELIARIHSGEIRCVVGTHALLQETVALPTPTLVIVDEQHRFGVAQRHALLQQSQDTAPHLLSMTATPIPRSLALTIFGDLDISSLRQMPKGRKPIGTAVVLESQRAGMWSHVREEVVKGRQVYVVCPLIDPSDALGTQSVKETAAELKKVALAGLAIDVLHGKLKSDEKQSVLEAFRAKKIDVLVATTVVEVGVDVPNATMMVVMGAERFGLAQLHQLRGRIGRSDLLSFCYLLPDHTFGSAIDRLRLLEKISDGFELAEKDLQLRGAGNVFGTAQSGFPDFQLATEADIDLMKRAREHTVSLLAKDPDLTQHPQLKQQINASFEKVHLE